MKEARMIRASFIISMSARLRNCAWSRVSRYWRGTTPYCGQSLNFAALLDQLLAPVTRP